LKPILATPADVTRIQEEVLHNAEDGWKETEVTVEPAELPGLSQARTEKLIYRDICDIAKGIFCSKEIEASKLVLHAGALYQRRQHVHDAPHR